MRPDLRFRLRRVGPSTWDVLGFNGLVLGTMWRTRHGYNGELADGTLLGESAVSQRTFAGALFTKAQEVTR